MISAPEGGGQYMAAGFGGVGVRESLTALPQLTFHGSKVNRSEAVRWSTDIRYVRTRGTYAASEFEREAEDYMYDKLRRLGRRAPMVVRGEGTKWSFKEWRRASEAGVVLLNGVRSREVSATISRKEDHMAGLSRSQLEQLHRDGFLAAASLALAHMKW